MQLFRGVFMKIQLSSLRVSKVFLFIFVLGLSSSSNVFGGVLINFEVTDLKAPPEEKKAVGRLSADVFQGTPASRE